MATRTPSPTPEPSDTCAGDCDGNGQVTMGELVTGIGIILETIPLATCPAFDRGNAGTVTVGCLTQAVSSALSGCPD